MCCSAVSLSQKGRGDPRTRRDHVPCGSASTRQRQSRRRTACRCSGCHTAPRRARRACRGRKEEGRRRQGRLVAVEPARRLALQKTNRIRLGRFGATSVDPRRAARRGSTWPFARVCSPSPARAGAAAVRTVGRSAPPRSEHSAERARSRVAPKNISDARGSRRPTPRSRPVRSRARSSSALSVVGLLVLVRSLWPR